jgi:hypothetical protein
MWKSMGVVGLWVSLIALPHFGPTVCDANFASAAPPVAVPSDDDLGDPPAPPAAPVAAPAREISGSFATLHFKNALGKTFVLLEVHVTMDGKALPALTNVAPDDDVTLFAGRVQPGHHVVDTRLVCRGKRRGPFTYLSDYKWEVASEEVLTVPAEDAIVFTLSATRNKGFDVPLDKQVVITAHDVVVPNPLSMTR